MSKWDNYSACSTVYWTFNHWHSLQWFTQKQCKMISLKFTRPVHGDNKPLLFSLGCGKKIWFHCGLVRLSNSLQIFFFVVPLSIGPYVINIVYRGSPNNSDDDLPKVYERPIHGDNKPQFLSLGLEIEFNSLSIRQ